MTVAEALHDPRPCPCGGKYIVVKRPDGSPSLMHSKPPCAAYHSKSPLAFLVSVEGKPDEATAPAMTEPKPNRRQRRAMASRSRRGR